MSTLTPVACVTPLFVTVTVYVTASPTVTGSGAAMAVTARSFCDLPGTSEAPMSQRPVRGAPRWSVASQASPPLPGMAGLPASTAGLAAVQDACGAAAAVQSACVFVGP